MIDMTNRKEMPPTRKVGTLDLMELMCHSQTGSPAPIFQKNLAEKVRELAPDQNPWKLWIRANPNNPLLWDVYELV